MSLLKGNGSFDQITRSVGFDGFFIFSDDNGAFIPLLRSGVVINCQHSWLLLQTREKLVQKRFDLLELFWSGLAGGDGEKHAGSSVRVSFYDTAIKSYHPLFSPELTEQGTHIPRE